MFESSIWFFGSILERSFKKMVRLFTQPWGPRLDGPLAPRLVSLKPGPRCIFSVDRYFERVEEGWFLAYHVDVTMKFFLKTALRFLVLLKSIFKLWAMYSMLFSLWKKEVFDFLVNMVEECQRYVSFYYCRKHFQRHRSQSWVEQLANASLDDFALVMSV